MGLIGPWELWHYASVRISRMSHAYGLFPFSSAQPLKFAACASAHAFGMVFSLVCRQRLRHGSDRAYVGSGHKGSHEW